MAKPEFSVVVPVFNSEDTLVELFNRINVLFEELHKSYEVIFVDDGGTDGSWNVLTRLKEKKPDLVTAIKLTRNFGQHNATYCGLTHAKGEMIITIDDDLQNPPEEIKKLIDCYTANDADLVYGLYADKKHSSLRNLGSKSLKKSSKMFYKGPGKGSSFRLLTRDLAQHILRHHQHFMYLDELFHWYTDKISSVYVLHSKRKFKKSGYSSFRLFGLFANILIYYSNVPLKLMVYGGLAASVFTFIIGMFFIFKKIFLNAPIQGYTSLIVTITFSTGLILLCLGIIGEYLSRIYMVQNKKPPFTIKKIL